MIPDFNEYGLLPIGVHWSSIEEVKEKLGFSTKRMELINGLEEALRNFKAAGCKKLYLDGSFVTSKLEPGDIDVCYDHNGIDPTKLDSVFFDFKNERAAQKKKYLCEFFMSHWGAVDNPPITYFEFFQKDKHSGKTKGIVGLKL